MYNIVHAARFGLSARTSGRVRNRKTRGKQGRIGFQSRTRGPRRHRNAGRCRARGAEMCGRRRRAVRGDVREASVRGLVGQNPRRSVVGGRGAASVRGSERAGAVGARSLGRIPRSVRGSPRTDPRFGPEKHAPTHGANRRAHTHAPRACKVRGLAGSTDGRKSTHPQRHQAGSYRNQSCSPAHTTGARSQVHVPSLALGAASSERSANKPAS